MSNHFPTSPSGYHVQQISYRVQVFTDPGIDGWGGDPTGDWIAFAFDTGIDGCGNPTYDYGSFDQDATESAIATAISDTLTASGNGSASYCLLRVWVLEADNIISGAYPDGANSNGYGYAPTLSWMEVVTGTPEFP